MRGTGAPESALLHVRVQPRASRDEVLGWQGSVLRVRVSAPPVEGEANWAVCALVASGLGLPAGAVTLLGGERGRDKVVRIHGLSHEAVRERIKVGRL